MSIEEAERIEKRVNVGLIAGALMICTAVVVMGVFILLEDDDVPVVVELQQPSLIIGQDGAEPTIDGITLPAVVVSLETPICDPRVEPDPCPSFVPLSFTVTNLTNAALPAVRTGAWLRIDDQTEGVIPKSCRISPSGTPFELSVGASPVFIESVPPECVLAVVQEAADAGLTETVWSILGHIEPDIGAPASTASVNFTLVHPDSPFAN